MRCHYNAGPGFLLPEMTLGPAWRSVGARASAGARFVNFYLAAWNGFIEAWSRGLAFGDAVAQADNADMRLEVQTFIACAEARAWQQGTREGYPHGTTVLGAQSSARTYFVSRWLAEEEWQPGMTARENMDYSSYMFRSGDKQLTKYASCAWT